MIARDKLFAPWTDAQVATLARYQARGDFHPYTCRDSSHGPLVPTRDGWTCATCDYRQDWALTSSLEMADAPSLIEQLRRGPAA